MRIISGKHKGRKFIAPNNLPVRPTTDSAKESLFNILSNNFDLDGLEVLDLFSGTGNISYEFISRGAKEVVSVDENYHCISFQKRSKIVLNADNFSPYKNDVFKALRTVKKKFDIIFADPPYDLPNIPEIEKMVFENELLKEGGWLIIEHSKETKFQSEKLQETRNYGKVNFTIFY